MSDGDVALDPELLGKVFENLLGAFNPETKEAARTRILRRHREDQLRLSAETVDDPAEKRKRFADLDRMLAEQKGNHDYARKLRIIENCIYGVDIQPIAAQISKLRFYISLLCDLPDPPDGTPLAEAFVALPNLKSKFVCANTLLPLPDVGGEFDFSGGRIPWLRAELREIRHAIFQARGWKTKRKYQEKEKAKRAEIAAAVSASLCTPDADRIRRAAELLGRLQGEWETVREPKWEERRKPVQDALFGDSPAQEVSLERFDANEEKRRRLARVRDQFGTDEIIATVERH